MNMNEIIEKILNEEDEVKKAFAKNTETPPEILRELAKDEDDEMKRILAGNPSTPEDVLREFLSSGEYKEELLGNSATPMEWLIETSSKILPDFLEEQNSGVAKRNLTRENYSEVCSLAGNKSIPPQILQEISDEMLKRIEDVLDRDEFDNINGIVEEIYLNPSLPVGELQRAYPILLSMHKKYLELYIENNDEYIQRSVDMDSVMLRVVMNPSTPLEIIEELFEYFEKYDGDGVLRGSVIENPTIPIEKMQEFMRKLWSIGDEEFKEHYQEIIAKDLRTPRYILKELENDCCFEIALNSAASIEMRERALENIKEVSNKEDFDISTIIKDSINPIEIYRIISENRENKLSLDEEKAKDDLEKLSLDELEEMKKQLEATNKQKNDELQQLRKKQMIEEIRGLIEQNNQLEQQITELREAPKEETSK